MESSRFLSEIMKYGLFIVLCTTCLQGMSSCPIEISDEDLSDNEFYGLKRMFSEVRVWSSTISMVDNEFDLEAQVVTNLYNQQPVIENNRSRRCCMSRDAIDTIETICSIMLCGGCTFLYAYILDLLSSRSLP